jgi:hypothetical protein
MGKSRAFLVTGLGGLQDSEMLRIPHCLDNQLTDDSKDVIPMHRPHFTPQKHYFSVSVIKIIVQVHFYCSPTVTSNLTFL